MWSRLATAALVVAALALVSVATAKELPSSKAFREMVMSRVTPSAMLAGAQADASTELMHDLVPSSTAHTRMVWMEVTAYCPCAKCCGKNAAGITASGKSVSYNAGRFVAADTAHLPFGTKLIIPGYQEQPVEVIDRGSSIKGNKLDVFFPNHDQAKAWGRKWVLVNVVG